MKKEYEGIVYNDDRMFVLYLCKCTISENDEFIVTTIHHNETPRGAIWSVITFRNNERYTAVKGSHFESKEEAEAFTREIEPQTPLVSLNGSPPLEPLSYQEFLSWKERNNFEEYDYKKMFLPDTVNATENLYLPKKET
jgi:hypothetical protein